MAGRLSDALSSVTDGTSAARSLRDQMDGISTSWELFLIWGTTALVALWQTMGDPGRAVLSGEALSAGRWWTPLTYMFAPAADLSWLISFFFLIAVFPATPRVTVRQGIREGLAILGFFVACGLVGALGFLAAYWGRTDPMFGVWPAAMGILAYRLVRGRKDWWSRRDAERVGAAKRTAVSWRERLREGAEATAYFVLGAIFLSQRGVLEWAPVNEAILAVGGRWPALALAASVIFVVAAALPPKGALLGLSVWLLYLAHQIPEILIWLVEGPAPWAALLAAAAFGGLLGLLLPKLLPRPETLAESA